MILKFSELTLIIMEVIESENVKVPNSLISTGLSHTGVDEGIFDYLKQYGKIARVIEVSDA